MSKIADFIALLDKGVDWKEAAKQAGIADATARTQHAKWKKAKAESQD